MVECSEWAFEPRSVVLRPSRGMVCEIFLVFLFLERLTFVVSGKEGRQVDLKVVEVCVCYVFFFEGDVLTLG